MGSRFSWPRTTSITSPRKPERACWKRRSRASGLPKLHSARSEEHTSELQSLMRISYAVFCLKKNNNNKTTPSLKPHHQNKTKLNKYTNIIILIETQHTT